MRLMTLFALFALVSTALGSDCLAQTTGEDVVNAVLGLAPAQGDTQPTRRLVLSSDTVQNNTGQRTFFAFEPSFRGDVKIAVDDGQQGGDVVTGSREGSNGPVLGQDGATNRSFFAFGSAFRVGVQAVRSGR